MKSLTLTILMFLPFFLAVGAALVWALWFGRDRRRSPLNVDPFHFPAEGLRRELAKLDERFSETSMQMVMLGPFAMSIWLGIRARDVGWAQVKLGGFDLVLGLTLLAAMAWLVTRLVRTGRRMRQYREGIAAELAVAQYLLDLPEQGYRVMHDIPGRDFNIDHVVIGHNAVFAIETKSRKKPEARGKASARVVFDGKCLRFPSHTEVQPLDQTCATARWLSDYLRKELGETVCVVPVLALPGWYVELTREGSKSDVIVNNCKVPNFMKSPRFGPPLAPEVRNRIRTALARRYEIAEVERKAKGD